MSLYNVILLVWLSVLGWELWWITIDWNNIV